MGNITKINVAGQTYDIQDERVQQTITDIETINGKIAGLATLDNVSTADTLSVLFPSCVYNIKQALLIFENSGSGIGAMKQTLIQGGKVQYRYNIKQGATSMDSTYWGEWQDNSAKTIEWSESFNVNDYHTQGIYYISGERAETDDNMPILNTGHISGQLTVLNANGCVTQYLKLTNAGGSEGKEYIRTYANGSWSMWQELKQTANLGQVSDDQLKEYVDNGYYEGAIVNSLSDMNNMTTIVTGFLQTIGEGTERLVSGTLFSMEVLNNYAITSVASSLMGVTVPRSVTQKAKILLINDGHYDGTSYLEVQRTKIGDANFGNWKLVNTI